MTREEEEQVRRALASLPAPEAMPPEVAARLDARLAELRAEAAQDAAPAPDRTERGRRRWPTLLVAAALVAVVGVGVGSVLDEVTSPDAMESTGAGDAGGGQAGGQADEEALQAAPDQGPSARGHAAQGAVTDRMVLTAERVELHSGRLAAEVEEFVELRLLRAAADDEVHSERNEQPAAGRRLRRLFEPCLLPLTTKGDQLVAVRLDAEPATLVLRAPSDGTRVAQVYSCDHPSRVLGRVEVAAR